MKKSPHLALLPALFIGISSGFSAAPPPEPRFCAYTQTDYDALQVTVNDNCMLSVGTSDFAAPRYRSYDFYPEGSLLVFVSTDDDPRLSRSTGSRVYFTAPRKVDVEPAVIGETGETVTVQGPAGQIAVFSKLTAQLISLEGYSVTVAPEILLTNRVGVEVKPNSGRLLIDTDFKLGGTGYDPNRRDKPSFIRDGQGKSCTVKNLDLFVYVDGEPDFKFPDDASLAEFLKQKCPALDRSPVEVSLD